MHSTTTIPSSRTLPRSCYYCAIFVLLCLILTLRGDSGGEEKTQLDAILTMVLPTTTAPSLLTEKATSEPTALPTTLQPTAPTTQNPTSLPSTAPVVFEEKDIVPHWRPFRPNFDMPATTIPQDKRIPCGTGDASVYCNLPPVTSERDPRGVIFILLPPASAPNAFSRFRNIVHQIDTFYRYPVEYMFFHEGFSNDVMIQYASVTNRRVLWVDVSSHFRSRLPPKTVYTGCLLDQRIGYRYMCQFMSGPVYALRAFDGYKYAMRFDLDSGLTSNVMFNAFDVMDAKNAVYGFAVEEGDDHSCQTGFAKFMRLWTEQDAAKRNVSMPIRSPYLFPGQTWDSYNAMVFNCNFEVVRLDYFRSEHYRAYHKSLVESNLFFNTRLGDHGTKTMYLELFADPKRILCLSSLPYLHAGRRNPCSSHIVH